MEKQENNVLTIHGLPEAKLWYRTGLHLKSVSMNILINNVAEIRILVSSLFQVRRGNRDDLGLSFIIFL